MLIDAAASLPPIAFDLAKLRTAADACASPDRGEIVVCARRRGPDDRITAEPDPPEAMPRAETRLFGQLRGGVRAQQQTVGGFPSNRMMMTLTLPF